MQKLSIAVIAATCFSLLGCGVFPESSFELARESRLPKWFKLPAGLSRSDVTLKLDYYSDADHFARFTLLSVKSDTRLAEVNCTDKSFVTKNQRPGLPPTYPLYYV